MPWLVLAAWVILQWKMPRPILCVIPFTVDDVTAPSTTAGTLFTTLHWTPVGAAETLFMRIFGTPWNDGIRGWRKKAHIFSRNDLVNKVICCRWRYPFESTFCLSLFHHFWFSCYVVFSCFYVLRESFLTILNSHKYLNTYLFQSPSTLMHATGLGNSLV